MSLSKPIRHCPSNCRGCATFAAFGGERFPYQPPGSPLAQCYEYARAAGIIHGPASSTTDLVPAPLSIPARSAKRPVGGPLYPSSAQVSESGGDALVRAAAIARLTAADTGAKAKAKAEVEAEAEIAGYLPQSRVKHAMTSKEPKLDFDLKQPVSTRARARPPQTKSRARPSSPPYTGVNYDVEDPEYPLGHAYIPPGIDLLANDSMFTVTTKSEQHATTFVGRYAMRMYDAYRASGIDMRTYEVRGEWEKLGAKRWIFSLGPDADMGRLNKVLDKGRDAVMAVASEKLNRSDLLREYERTGIAVESKRLGVENAFRDMKKAVEEGRLRDRQSFADGPLNTEAMQRIIQEILAVKFDPLDWEGPDWIGGVASISPLPPRQRPLRVGSGMGGVVTDDENDETACTTYVRLAPMKQMDFSWYQRQDVNDIPVHQWPHCMRWVMSDGRIRDFSMQEIYDSLNAKLSLLKESYMFENSAANFASRVVWSQWRKMAKEMINFEWFWDEDKRILVQGYSGHHDYEKDCDWIDEQMDNWKGYVQDELEANRKAVKSGSLTKKEARCAMMGEHLLRQWKEGPGIMVSRTPSDARWEGCILGPHTTDGASHINYLNARIAFATRQREEIERMWVKGAAAEEALASRRELIEYIDVLEALNDDIGEQNRREETGLSPIFKDKDTRKQVNEWGRECREKMRLWDKEAQEEG
ncbi:hypothetical protein DSL72_005128 [Monilinia vaccinii-corymbosi]|uniref:Uncharacterized protein n=1 Tax=Monilinia vaccinii-corymbosi TaxID=61207 RepID=A0A8A3PEP5_9HELO|nr:hypothetical protein DSL72_005128 [Monilinia vaccinii-corymbosi]